MNRKKTKNTELTLMNIIENEEAFESFEIRHRSVIFGYIKGNNEMMIVAREWTVKEKGGENENGHDSICNLFQQLCKLNRNRIPRYCIEIVVLKSLTRVENNGFFYSI